MKLPGNALIAAVALVRRGSFTSIVNVVGGRVRLLAWLVCLFIGPVSRPLIAGDEPVVVEPVRFRGEMGAAIRSSCSLGDSLVRTFQRACEERRLSPSELALVIECVWKVAFHVENSIASGRSLLPAGFHASVKGPLQRLEALCHDARGGRLEAAGARAWLDRAAEEIARIREAAAELEPVMCR